jgi:hypothetical protein
MRLYQPSTLADLAAAYAGGEIRPDADAVVSDSEAEEDEYAALMTAADLSAARLNGLADGLRRRVVVVLEAADQTVPVPLRDVVSVHADTADDAGADDDLAWWATQELDELLAGFA